ncbi:GNAT family N-acetyltransferase [Virgibacillus ainsalahensis]
MNIKLVETNEEKEQAFNIRMQVFVEEQKVPADEELDEQDATAIHFIGYQDGEPVAASRLRFVGDYGKLERICVLKKERGKSYGSDLIQTMENEIRKHGYQKAKLNGQIHAEKFYQNLGYETVSGEFMDAGIPHVAMIKQL